MNYKVCNHRRSTRGLYHIFLKSICLSIAMLNLSQYDLIVVLFTMLSHKISNELILCIYDYMLKCLYLLNVNTLQCSILVGGKGIVYELSAALPPEASVQT